MPWPYAAEAGIVKKWADKYGITIKVTQINDYVESINQYTAGKFDGVTVTNMDALTIPAAGGVDTTALIVGDFSNGNDGIVLKKGKTLADIKGRKVNLVELSVSHYLLARGLSSGEAAARSDIKVVNTSDADIVGAFKSPDIDRGGDLESAADGSQGRAGRHARSSTPARFPARSIDLLVGQHRDAEGQSRLRQGAGRRLVRDHGADDRPGEKGKAAREAMAKLSGTDLAGYDAQLKTTLMFYTPADAVAFATSPELPRPWTWCARSRFEHGLLGEGVKSKDAVGIAASARQDARATEEREAALRRHLHARWRRTASSDAVGSHDDRTAAGARHSPRVDEHRRRARGAGIARSALLPFVLIALLYVVGSAERRAENPTTSCCRRSPRWWTTVQRLAFEPDRRTGEIVLWADTAASLRRLALGLGIATLIGLAFGLSIGLLPLVGASLSPLVAVLSMIPPMAVLPILFIVFGLGELSKVVLIVIGIAPFLIRDLPLAVGNLPARATGQGADARRLDLADRDPRRAAADDAAADRGGAAVARPGLAVPDLGRGDRRRGRARLPHLPGAALSRDGRHPALRRLDHAAGLRHRPRACAARAPRLSLGLRAGAALMSAHRRSATSGTSTATRSCSSASTSRSQRGSFVSHRRPVGRGKSTFLRLMLGQERPTRGADHARRRAAAGRARPGPRRRVPALFGVSAPDRARQRADRLRVRAPARCSAGCSARRAARRSTRAARCSRRSASRAHATSIRARSPAACSSGWRSPRRW